MLDNQGLDEAANAWPVPARACAASRFTANMPGSPISGVGFDIPDEAASGATAVSCTFMGQMVGIAIVGNELARAASTFAWDIAGLGLAWPVHSHSTTIYAP